MKLELRSMNPSSGDPRTRVAAQFSSSKDRISSVVGGLFFVIGIGLLAAGLFSARNHYYILKDWPRVDATVTKSRVTTGRDRRGTAMYGTQLEFRYTVDGKEYVTPATSSYRSSSYVEMKRQADIFAPGSRHAIVYDPGDPNDMRFDAGYNFSFFLAATILGGMGVIFAGVGALVWFLFRSAGGVVPLCPSCNRPIEMRQEFCPHCATPLLSN